MSFQNQQAKFWAGAKFCLEERTKDEDDKFRFENY
jgi:hypothetical protein